MSVVFISTVEVFLYLNKHLAIVDKLPFLD